MKTEIRQLAASLAAVALTAPVLAADTRQIVTMPAPMQEHMLSNMRDHLAALGEIQAALGAGKYDRAAEIAENRIGMSSLQSHGAAHMAPHMPKPMQDIGTEMHRAASRFARVTQEADMNNNLSLALNALADLSKQCVACHAAYRLK